MWLILACTVALAGSRRPLPPEPVVALSHQGLKGHSHLVVKFTDGTKLERARAIAKKHHLTLEPVVHMTPAIRGLVQRAEKRSGHKQPDYRSLLRARSTGSAAAKVGAKLSDHRDVELTWHNPGLAPLPAQDDTEAFLKLQGYHMPNPGIDARYAWDQDIRGKGVRISDVEFMLNPKHEDMGRVNLEAGQKPIDPWGTSEDHGTAVMGVVLARPDKNGCRGIAHAAEGAFYPMYTAAGDRVEEAILTACADSDVGDIVMIELQTMGPQNWMPMEYDAGAWMATRTCADAGVVVVAAAGNGAIDLDAAEYKEYRDRGHSGAIIVGAGTGGTTGKHTAESFSNHGDRVDLQGWGSSVFTLGYGDHAVVEGNEDRSYTAKFNGTSSATPVVAGAAALVQEAALRRGGKKLGPQDLRDLLVKTGVKQEGSKHIGPLPDVRAALNELGIGKKAARKTTKVTAKEGGTLDLDAAPIVAIGVASTLGAFAVGLIAVAGSLVVILLVALGLLFVRSRMRRRT
jgi:subtilisin family serine protease